MDRLGTAREEFHALLDEDELRGAVVLVYANKQDCHGALSEAQVRAAHALRDAGRRALGVAACGASLCAPGSTPACASLTRVSAEECGRRAQVAEGLGLHDIKNRDWAIFKASAVKGEGLMEGLDWLANMLKTRR